MNGLSWLGGFFVFNVEKITGFCLGISWGSHFWMTCCFVIGLEVNEVMWRERPCGLANAMSSLVHRFVVTLIAKRTTLRLVWCTYLELSFLD